MGMYDTFVIEGLKLKTPKEITSLLKANKKELPREYQSKDLFSSLNTYYINESGQILEEVRQSTGKKIPYKSPLLDWKDNRPYLERLYWKIKHREYYLKEEDRLIEEVKLVKRKSKLTNTFNIYTAEVIGGRYIDLEYEIKAVEGKVKSAKLIKWSIESEEDANKRAKQDKEFKLKMEAEFAHRKELHSRWYYPIIKETFNPLVFFARLIVQSICNKIVKISYRWTGI